MSLPSAKTGAWLLLAGSVLALGGAFLGQYGFDLHPCVLCIYQRWPHGVVIALALLAIAISGPRARAALLALAGVALAIGAVIAAYHVGVEQGWWQGIEACTAQIGGAKTLKELEAQIMAAQLVRCDEVAWSLFGISMAGYNFLFSAVMAGLALLLAGPQLRARRTP